jgi:hypothetical protein
MNKKFIASVLTISMLMGLSVPAMAGSEGSIDWDDGKISFEISGNSIVKEPTIELNLPTNDQFVLNPFRIDAQVLEQSVSGQVVGAVHELHNSGNVDVKIEVTSFVATPNQGYNADKKGFPIAIATSPVKAKDWAKSKTAYICLQMSNDKKVVDADDVPTRGVAKAVCSFDKNNKAIDAAKKGGKLVGTNAMTIKQGEEGFYRIKGNVNENPKQLGGKADDHDVWKGTDEIAISYKLVFTPVKN